MQKYFGVIAAILILLDSTSLAQGKTRMEVFREAVDFNLERQKQEHPNWFNIHEEIKDSYANFFHSKDKETLKRNYKPNEALNTARDILGINASMSSFDDPNIFDSQNIRSRMRRISGYLEEEEHPFHTKQKEHDQKISFQQWKDHWRGELENRVKDILFEIDKTNYLENFFGETFLPCFYCEHKTRDKEYAIENSYRNFVRDYILSSPREDKGINFTFKIGSEMLDFYLGLQVDDFIEDSINLSEIPNEIANGNISTESFDFLSKIFNSVLKLDEFVSVAYMLENEKENNFGTKLDMAKARDSFTRADLDLYLKELAELDTTDSSLDFLFSARKTFFLPQNVSNNHSIGFPYEEQAIFEVKSTSKQPNTNIQLHISTSEGTKFSQEWKPPLSFSKSGSYAIRTLQWIHNQGEILVPIKDQMQLAKLSVRIPSGTYLREGIDFKLYSDTNQKFIQLKVPDHSQIQFEALVIPKSKVKVKKQVEPELTLDREVLSEIIEDMIKHKLFALADHLKQKLSSNQKTTVIDIKDAIRESSLYTFISRKQTNTTHDPTSFFRDFEHYLNNDNKLCMQCTGASALLQKILQNYQMRIQKLGKEASFSKVELVVGFVEENGYIYDAAHRWLRVWNRDETGYVDLDPTPTEMEPGSPRMTKERIEKRPHQLDEDSLNHGKLFTKARALASKSILNKSKKRYAQLDSHYRNPATNNRQDILQFLAGVEQVIRKFGLGKKESLTEARNLALALTGKSDWIEIAEEFENKLRSINNLSPMDLSRALGSKMSPFEFKLWLEKTSFEVSRFKGDLLTLKNAPASEWIGSKFCREIFKK